MHLKLLLWLKMFLLLGITYSWGQSKEQVIEKYLKAIGGRENWLSIQTMVDSGMIVNYNSNLFRADTIYYSRILVRPDKQKYTTYKKPSGPLSENKFTEYSTCYNGKYLWTGSAGKITLQSPEESEAFKNTITLGLPDLFLFDKTAEIEYMGKMELNNTAYEVLKTKGTHQYFYSLTYFDLITGLPSCITGFDTPIKRFSYSKEYKWAGNILVDMAVENYVDGILKGSAFIKYIQINKAINTSVFNEPNR